MSENLTDEEICKQLLELATTQEQVRYLTVNNTTVLTDKIKSLKQLINEQDKTFSEQNKYNVIKREAYLDVTVEVIMRMMRKAEDRYY